MKSVNGKAKGASPNKTKRVLDLYLDKT